jgi:hypothetical protein
MISVARRGAASHDTGNAQVSTTRVGEAQGVFAVGDAAAHLAIGRQHLAPVGRKALEEFLGLFVAELGKQGGCVHRCGAEQRIGHADLAS